MLLLGVMAGAVMQKYIGVGNILRDIGIPYPTTEVTVPTNTLPIAEIPKPYQGQMRLFILAGQSNMVGWAPIPDDEQSHSRIFLFGNDYRWHIASEPIDIAFNQVDKVSEDRIADFGPSMAFAIASLEHHPEITIGLIPCAKNSSAIAQWQRNLSDQSLYGSCLKRARAASPMGRISGILFFQGEADAVDPIQYPKPEPHPTEWAKLFSAFATDFRKDLHEPYLPIIFAQLGPTINSDGFPYWDLVKSQQRSIQSPMIGMIKTDDLSTLDGLHFTADSYRIIGRRFAETYWELVNPNDDK
jgi:hypothetical protein